MDEIEVYQVDYQGKLPQYEEYFANPKMIKLPQNVSSDCFDVIVIDGPAGWLPEHAGQFTFERCVPFLGALPTNS